MVLDKLVYSYEEVGVMFEVPPWTIQRWVRTGRLRTVGRGKITVGSTLHLADLSSESLDFGPEERQPDKPRYQPQTRLKTSPRHPRHHPYDPHEDKRQEKASDELDEMLGISREKRPVD